MSKYLRNTWYPLTWSSNVEHSLKRHTVIEEDIVVFRKTNGEIAALSDACPHRLAPLSIGRLVGDSIECGYHGMTFNCSGQCEKIPGQRRVPSNIQVRSYPVTENMGMVWIWMGDADKADKSKVFDLKEFHDPNYSYVLGDALVVHANYLNLADNLCDPSHVAFVHQSTLSNKEHGEVPVHHERLEDRVVTWRWINDSPLIPVFKGQFDYEGNVDRWHYYHYFAPSVAMIDFGSAPTGTGAEQGNRENCIQMFACHFITPIDERNCIQHWLCVKNIPSDPEKDAKLLAGLRIAFDEDKAVLQAIQKNEDKLVNFKKARIAIDVSNIKMRQMLDEMIEKEQLENIPFTEVV